MGRITKLQNEIKQLQSALATRNKIIADANKKHAGEAERTEALKTRIVELEKELAKVISVNVDAVEAEA